MNALLSIAITILRKLVTEKFVSRMIIIGLRQIEKSTGNSLVKSVVDSVAEALGDPCNDCKLPE